MTHDRVTSSRKPRRALRRLIVFLVVVVILAVVADRVAEYVAEDRLAVLAEDEAARYDVRAADTSVEVGGFGFLPQLARGNFSRITMTMRQPTYSSVSAEDLTVDMTRIAVPRAALTGDPNAPITVGAADIRLRLSPDALTKLVARATGADRVTLRIADGKLRARVTVLGAEAEATVRPQLTNGRLSFLLDEAADVPAAARGAVTRLLGRGIRLPSLPFGASLTGVGVDGQSLTLTATAADLRLRG